jgi:hypothetical protein
MLKIFLNFENRILGFWTIFELTELTEPRYRTVHGEWDRIGQSTRTGIRSDGPDSIL